MTPIFSMRRVTGIIGVPGDRDNTVITHAARVAAKGFNRLIVKEDRDLRGSSGFAAAAAVGGAAEDPCSP